MESEGDVCLLASVEAVCCGVSGQGFVSYYPGLGRSRDLTSLAGAAVEGGLDWKSGLAAEPEWYPGVGVALVVWALRAEISSLGAG